MSIVERWQTGTMLFFEIDKDNLQRLNDTDLRELVGRLCEAELAAKNLPTSAVGRGGDQNAPDGGLDVVVRLEIPLMNGDFIQRPSTSFQVKKSKMPPAAIKKEMRPSGHLRPAIRQLAEEGGAYIMVSAGDDCSDTMRDQRIKAMRSAVDGTISQECMVDFYDCSRLATWLRACPGVQLWVRQKLGRPLSGWRPFGRWSQTPEEFVDTLILGEDLRLSFPDHQDKRLLEDGLSALRQRIASTATRVVGLSGIGKTRFVQALFEDTIGQNALPPSCAVYADLGEAPTPPAREVLEHLMTENQNAVLVLDNCPSDVHGRLAKTLKEKSTKVTLITVEYDVGDDQPEATEVVRLEAVGTSIVKKLIERRFPDLGQMNAERIAELSGGNARLALALANTAMPGDNLGALQDQGLFQRLFVQHKPEDSGLLKAAEALALVYSFNTKVNDELAMLGHLVDKDSSEMYCAASELVDRQLAQKRGIWCAVLPHALANYLARNALKKIPQNLIKKAFKQPDQVRLLKSFAHRLGYLHDCEEARAIVQTWYQEDGPLADISTLDEDRVQVFRHVAPVDPSGALAVIERSVNSTNNARFASRPFPYLSQTADLLMALAYEPELFEQSVDLLIRFALTEHNDESHNHIRNHLSNFFSLYGSGTKAFPEQRAMVLERCLKNKDKGIRALGLGMLNSALKNSDWTNFPYFKFGARPRDYGYQPSSPEERDEWFLRFLRIVTQEVSSGYPDVMKGCRDSLASHFRGLWRCYPALRISLEQLAHTLNKQEPWIEGWRATRQILKYDKEALSEEEQSHIQSLSESLAPLGRGLAVEIKALGSLWDLKIDLDGPYEEKAFNLGVKASQQPDVLDELGAELFSCQGLYHFGRGLADAANDPHRTWKKLVGFFCDAGENMKNVDILPGFLPGFLARLHETNLLLYHELLDEALDLPECRRIFVSLQQGSAPLDERGIKRLFSVLDHDDTPLEQFSQISQIRWGSVQAMNEAVMTDLLLTISHRQGGLFTAIDILAARLSDKDKSQPGEAMLRVSLNLVIMALEELTERDGIDVMKKKRNIDNSADILTRCLDPERFPEEANRLITVLVEAIASSHVYLRYFLELTHILAVVMRALPEALLSSIAENKKISDKCWPEWSRFKFDSGNTISSVLGGVSTDVLLRWCQVDPGRRFLFIALAISPLQKSTEKGSPWQLTEQTLKLLHAAPDPTVVLDKLFLCTEPMGWSGSRADLMAERGRAFEPLLEDQNQEIADAVASHLKQLKSRENEARNQEKKDAERELRFE